MLADSLSPVWLLLWILTSVLIVYVRWRKEVLGAGLIFAYMLQMWTLYGVGAILYLISWYDYFEPDLVFLGLQQATYGFMALGAGSALIAPFILRRVPLLAHSAPRAPEPHLPRIYVAIGLICYLFLLPLAYKILSATAFSAAGWRLTTVGAALILWRTWLTASPQKFAVKLWCFALAFPLLTIITQGFLGFGATVVLALLAFVGSFFRPRWKVVVLGAFIGYLGLSVYVTYMRDRSYIREAVWGGEDVEERSGRLLETFREIEWFNPLEESHLQRVDERLNQNALVGIAVEYLSSGFEKFMRGETVQQAFLSLIPRAIWPGKPIYAGGGDLVSRFTGIEFAEGTSVGIGQVMEFYVNWGTAGVVCGFLILGTLVALIDLVAAQRLKGGDWQGFAYFYLPGLSLIETGVSLVEMLSSAAAGVATIYLINRYLLHRWRGKEAVSEEPSVP